MTDFVKIVSGAGTLMVRPDKVSAVAPAPGGNLGQCQVIIDGTPCVLPLTVEGFLSQLAGNQDAVPSGPRLIG